jgi:hypothetical protein
VTPKGNTYHELYNSSEEGLRAELALHGYTPSPVINKEILINMLMEIYFGGEKDWN